MWSASIGSTCVWRVIPCTDMNRFRLFLNWPGKSNKSLSPLSLLLFCRERKFSAVSSEVTHGAAGKDSASSPREKPCSGRVVIFIFKALSRYSFLLSRLYVGTAMPFHQRRWVVEWLKQRLSAKWMSSDSTHSF